MAEIQTLSPADLLIDTSNPRLLESSGGQREAQRDIAENQKQKLLKLAKDIAAYGLNPCDLPIVMANKGQRRRFTVLEGNRRLAAIRSLENPEAIVGAVPDKVLQGIREASRVYLENPVQDIDCLVVKSREEARHWIELRHTGENEGAGLVRWGADETSRYRKRTGKYEPHSQALDFLEDQGAISSAERKNIPTTSIKRLLSSPDVRAKLGVDVVNGELQPLADPAKVAKALKHVVNDFASGKYKVADIYTKEQRSAYAKKIPASVAVKASDADNTARKSKKVRRKKKTKRKRRVQEHLIPSDCELSIDDDRAADIEIELRNLRLAEYSNAVAVLLRVFVELSVDAYIRTNALDVADGSKLGERIRKVLEDLVSHKKLSKAQAAGIRTMLQKNSFLAPTVFHLHEYVHNPFVFPAASDLRQHWKGLQPFIVAIWS